MAETTISRTPDPSDLTDEQWELVHPLLPGPNNQHAGRKRTVDLREIVKTILDQNRSGCQ